LTDAANRRAHWLEAAARWISLGREQGVLLPRRTREEVTLPTNFTSRSALLAKLRVPSVALGHVGLRLPRPLARSRNSARLRLRHKLDVIVANLDAVTGERIE
jgi:hypothetical protein